MQFQFPTPFKFGSKGGFDYTYRLGCDEAVKPGIIVALWSLMLEFLYKLEPGTWKSKTPGLDKYMC